MDVFPMDNSNSKKEGVAYTYKGHDGYAPLGGCPRMDRTRYHDTHPQPKP
jgi:hypothetical protein